MISKSAFSIAKILSTVLLINSLHAQPTPAKPDPVVLTVGDRKIAASELCSAIGSLPPPQRVGYTQHPALAKDWFGPLVALAEEAKREQLRPPEDQKLSEVDRDNALVGELIQSIAEHVQPSDGEIETYYATHKSDFEQVKARHILISYSTAFASRSPRSASEARAKAEDISLQLKRGADFAALAVQSDDADTKSKGGDLGYVSHHQLEPAMDSALWSLASGQTSDPFDGRFGYEIVRVEERRTQSLDEVHDLIIGKIKAGAIEERQQQIISAAHITLAPDYADAPLPCETPPQPFTLKDSLPAP